jgi:hypothetical protein
MGQRVPLNLPSVETLVRIYRATAAPHNFIGTADRRSGYCIQSGLFRKPIKTNQNSDRLSIFIII